MHYRVRATTCISDFSEHSYRIFRYKKLWKKRGDLTEWQVTRVEIAERMGWTLEYVDSLSKYEVVALLGIWDGQRRKNAGKKRAE